MAIGGSSLGNRGPGGWAVVVRYRGRERALSGGEREGTSNQMALTALLAGLRALKEPCAVALITDSSYVAGIVEARTAVRRNRRLVQRVRAQLRTHRVTVERVAVHRGDSLTVRAERAARQAAEQMRRARPCAPLRQRRLFA